ncbi:MAG: HPr family phosphocarrier protein [Spirochaetaceae bacterium]
MVETTAVINNEKGIHVRPSGIIFKAILGYTGNIIVVKNSIETPVRDIISILTLGLAKDTNIIIRIDGPDEARMLSILKELFERSFEFEEM